MGKWSQTVGPHCVCFNSWMRCSNRSPVTALQPSLSSMPVCPSTIWLSKPQTHTPNLPGLSIYWWGSCTLRHNGRDNNICLVFHRGICQDGTKIDLESRLRGRVEEGLLAETEEDRGKRKNYNHSAEQAECRLLSSQTHSSFLPQFKFTCFILPHYIFLCFFSRSTVKKIKWHRPWMCIRLPFVRSSKEKMSPRLLRDLGSADTWVLKGQDVGEEHGRWRG